MQAKTFRTLTRTLVACVLGATLLGFAAPSSAVAAPSGPPASPSGTDAVNAGGPYELVKSAANTLLQDLDANRAEYRSDPAKLRELVNRVLLPHFDSQFAARAVLGVHWRTATPDQRQRFIDAFYHSLLNNYGNALLDLTADRLQVLPYRGPADAEYTTVDTRVRKSDGSVVQVNYSLRHTDQGWKVWDVIVEGVSYDKSFQEQFAEQIDREGLDAVINGLQRGETPLAIKRTTSS